MGSLPDSTPPRPPLTTGNMTRMSVPESRWRYPTTISPNDISPYTARMNNGLERFHLFSHHDSSKQQHQTHRSTDLRCHPWSNASSPDQPAFRQQRHIQLGEQTPYPIKQNTAPTIARTKGFEVEFNRFEKANSSTRLAKEKRSARQGRHRTACDRCRGRKAKVCRSSLPSGDWC